MSLSTMLSSKISPASPSSSATWRPSTNDEGRLGGRGHVLEVLRAAHHELELLDPEAHDLATAEVVAPGEADREVEAAGPAHEGVVHVEERRRRSGPGWG